MDFWKSALAAAEKAAEAAKDLGKKGLVRAGDLRGTARFWRRQHAIYASQGSAKLCKRACSHQRCLLPPPAPAPAEDYLPLTAAILPNMQEVVESTAEEASKKLNLNIYDKVGAGGAATAPPSEDELAAYGLTPAFAEFVQTLDYRWVVPNWEHVALVVRKDRHAATHVCCSTVLAVGACPCSCCTAVCNLPCCTDLCLCCSLTLEATACPPGRSTFRDFPAEHLLPTSEEGGSAAPPAPAPGGPAYRLNPWQVRGPVHTDEHAGC